MSAFSSGFKMGGDMWDSAEQSKRQKVLDDRATRDDEQKQTALTRQLGIQSKLDDAYKYSTSLDGGVVDGRTADFSGVNPMADQGPVPQDQMAPVVGMRPQGAALDSPAPALVSTPATQRDRLNIARTIATLKQDDAGIARLNEQGLVLDRKDNQRATMTRLQALSKDPGKSAEYATAIAPALKAFSEFDGLPANYHFDPKTKGIVETPYGTKDPKTGQTIYGAPREVPFETVAPYMLAYNNLVSEYGDPETAAAQLKTMKDGERTKRFEEAKQTLDSASKLSTADSAQTTAKAHMITAEAARQRANADKSGRGKEADPALVKRNNDLYETYINESDPAKKQGIVRQMQMVQNQIATSLGKPQMLPNSQGERGGLLKQSVEQKKNDDGSYTAFDKSTGEALYNTHNGDPMPLGMTLDRKTKLQKEAADSGVQMQVGENNGRLEYRYIGADGNPYVDVASAGKAKAPKAKTETAGTGIKTPGIDTSRYSREQVRGGSSYTYNPRGKTKAEWAAQDQNPQ